MNALILTYGGLTAAKILSAWLSTGNSVAALWIGSDTPRRFVRQDRMLGTAAPSWSISAMVRRHSIPVRRNPKLSTWTKADTAIRRLDADVLIAAMTRQIVPEDILLHFSGRAVNFHPTVLPYYRGAQPRLGMILDGKTDAYGGVTLHCLSPEIDKGDIIGLRKVPYEADRGLIHWEVGQARAAGSLVQTELQNYLNGRLRPYPQSDKAESYRKVRRTEFTLSDKHSASHIKWLCDQLGTSGWLRFRSRGANYPVSRFVRQMGPRTFAAERIDKFTVEFDAADARVRVARRRYRTWTPLFRIVRSLLAIVRTRRSAL